MKAQMINDQKKMSYYREHMIKIKILWGSNLKETITM